MPENSIPASELEALRACEEALGETIHELDQVGALEGERKRGDAERDDGPEGGPRRARFETGFAAVAGHVVAWA
ncbi:MAG: hypothetical protein Kow0069_38120 [Promethearchaeota archaeon]